MLNTATFVIRIAINPLKCPIIHERSLLKARQMAKPVLNVPKSDPTEKSAFVRKNILFPQSDFIMKNVLIVNGLIVSNDPIAKKGPIAKNDPITKNGLIVKSVPAGKNALIGKSAFIGIGKNALTGKTALIGTNALTGKNALIEKNAPIAKNVPIVRGAHITKRKTTNGTSIEMILSQHEDLQKFTPPLRTRLLSLSLLSCKIILTLQLLGWSAIHPLARDPHLNFLPLPR